MKKSRRTYNGVHLNKKSNTQDVVEQSLTLLFNATDKLKTFLPGNLIKNGKELQKDKIINSRS